MRRRTALLYTLPLFPLLAAAIAIGCSGDDSGGVHGEVFGPDASTLNDGGKIIDDGSIVLPDGNVITPDGSTTDGGPTCTTGTIAIIGGGPSSSVGAYATGNGPFGSISLSPSMAAQPAIIPFGAGFQAVFHGVGSDALFSTSFSGSEWSIPVAIAGTYALEMPTLAVVGATPNLVYEGNFDDAGGLDSHDYFHGTLSGTSWTANDPVGTAGVDQSFGPHALGAAGLATELVTGQVGSNNNVYARSFSGGAWQASVDIVSTAGSLGDDGTSGTAPRLVALTSGPEILAVYTRQTDYKLMAITRTGGAWQAAPTEIADADYTTEPFELAALAGGKAILAWRGATDMKGYVSVYNGTTWSTAMQITSFAINSAPAVAIGNCGSVAIAAYAKSTGSVEMIRYDGTSWGTPSGVTNLGSSTYVGVAVSP